MCKLEGFLNHTFIRKKIASEAQENAATTLVIDFL